MTRNPQFDRALLNIKKIHDKKNVDYAQDGNPYSNFEVTAAIAGVTLDQVFLTQIGNKIARILELTSGKEPNFESLNDSRMDLATYAALYYSYFLDQDANTEPTEPLVPPKYANDHTDDSAVVDALLKAAGHHVLPADKEFKKNDRVKDKNGYVGRVDAVIWIIDAHYVLFTDNRGTQHRVNIKNVYYKDF